MSMNKQPLGKTFAELLSKAKIIDLTVTNDHTLPCTVPEDQLFLCVPRTNFDIQGYLSNILIMSDHTGTHCDAPSHYLPGKRKNIADLPLTSFIGPCDVIDVRPLANEPGGNSSPVIKVDIIKEWEQINGPVEAGDIVLFYTGWSDNYYKPLPEGYKFDRSHPAPNGETIDYLLSKGVKHIGIDAVGLGMAQNDAEPHLVALERDVVVTEKLINLGQLPPRGALFIFLPIKVRCGGGVGRAIAIC